MARHRMVPRKTYALSFEAARRESDLVRNATSPTHEVVGADGMYYLADDRRSGFVVRRSGELVGVFSLERGRGAAIMADAVAAGASALDCFDGYLVRFYASHGFEEVRREPNWTAGEPDVVYMSLVERG